MAMVSKMFFTYCPACKHPQFTTLFMYQDYPVQQCQACSWVFLNPQPSEEILAGIYSEDNFLGSRSAEASRLVSRLKRKTAQLYLDHALQSGGPREGKLLEVGCGHGELLVEAAARGYEVCGLDVSPSAVRVANESLGQELVACNTLEQAGLPSAEFDICVCIDVIEHVRDPLAFLVEVHRVLKPGGTLLMVVPAFDSGIARFLEKRWFELKIEHLHYFGRATAQNILARSGFRSIKVGTNRRLLTLDYVVEHFMRYPVSGISSVLALISRFIPFSLRQRPFTTPTSSITILARAEDMLHTHPVVSVIVPVYNECETVTQVMEPLINKQLVGLDKEIIVVEGNSTDGSREAVLKYQDLPGVQIILTDQPRGKGHAVRLGLAKATGDFVLIQDADLEYDMNDYDELLEPLRLYRQAFVLGSRHKGHWRVRRFAKASFFAEYLNLGHIFFTILFNLLYGQNLSDPWTMYKVFRRDCLYGLQFECNRFDFDVELMAKLVRKGYIPVEIPVNYKSRSFSEGKKAVPHKLLST